MKIKIKHYMLIGTAALALLATSCKDMLGFDSDSGSSSQTGKALETAENINAVAFLTVSLDGVTAKSSSISSRTALPDFAAATGTSEEGVYGGYQYAGFTKFVLYGAKAGSDAAAIGNSEESPIRVWESHDSVTAYQTFKSTGASTIPIALSSGVSEEWDFTLVGYYGVTGKYITFEGTVSKSISPTLDGFELLKVTADDDFVALVAANLYTKDNTNNVFVQVEPNATFDSTKEYYTHTELGTTSATTPTNGLDFTLARTSKFVYPYSTSGEGKIEITLNYATGSALSGYKTIAKLYSATVSESVVTKSETPLANGLSTTADPDANVRLYSATGINEGMYVAVFEFTENGVEVGAMTEYVYVLKDLTSKSTLTVDLNGSYAITYRYWILDDTANQNVVVTSATQDTNGEYTFGLGARTESGFPGIAVGSEGNMFAEATFIYGDNNKISANDGGVVMTYSRLTGATLPKANLFSEDFNSTLGSSEYLFCGWYDITGSEAADNNTIAGLINDTENHTPVLEIKKNTFVQDKTYIAKFVKRVEMPVIDKVTITPETSAASDALLNNGYKVGYMLTATPSYGENEATPFTGTATWQWYWSADSENYSFDDEDTVSGTNATIAARDEAHVSTYRVEPSKAGKYLQARVVQKYKIVPEKIGDAIAYYKVTENAVVVSGVAKKDVESVPTPVEMALGTLQAVGSTNPEDENALFKMHYGTAATAEVVEIGTQLEASNLHVTSGVITDAHNPAWGYQHGTGNLATVSAYALSLTDEINDDHVYAPVGSNYVAVTVSVEGYEPLLLPNTVESGAPKSAFVSVKYKTPTEANVKSTLWSTADGADALEGIDKGYISFKGTKYSSSGNDYTNGETPIDVTDIPLSYKVGTGNGNFTPVTARATLGRERNATTDIPAGAVAFKAAEKIVDGDGNSEQDTDANGNAVGHIAESSDALSYPFSTDNSLAYIGTRQLISYIAVALDGTDSVTTSSSQSYTAKVGHRLTVKAYDENNQEITCYAGESGIDWTWTIADTSSTVVKTATDANTSYTIKQADYTSGTEETHTLTISASRTYAYSTPCEKTLTVRIDKGTMALNSPTITWDYKAEHNAVDDKFTVNTTKEDLAAALQLSISSGGLIDSVSTDSVTNVSVEFDGTLDDNGSGTAKAKVKFKAPGYDDLTPASGNEVYVTNIPLQAAIPAGVESSIVLSTDRPDISYGYIQFASVAAENGRILGTSTSSSGYYTYEMEYTTVNPMSVGVDVTWYDITPEEFAIPSGFPTDSGSGSDEATLYVRLKKKGDVNGETYYYSHGNGTTGAWKKADLTVVIGDTPSSSYEASDPIEVIYKNSDHGGTRGIAYGTKVTFTAVDAEKLKVSKANGIVTIGPEADWTASSWFVDGRKITSNSDPISITADGKQLIIDTTAADLLGGTYQITAFVTTTNPSKGISGVTYSAGASVTVSK